MDEPATLHSDPAGPRRRTLSLHDQWCAIYALALGATLLTVIKRGDWPAWIFDNTDKKASQALDEWRSGAPMINAKRYAEACRRLRRITYR